MNRTHARSLIRWRLLFWTYTAAWTTLLLVPLPDMEVLAGMLPPAAAPTEGPWDKPVHAAGYLCLLVLAVSAYGRGSNRLLWSAILLAAAAHGGAAELAQWMLNTRQADWFDWFADLAGIAAGALLISAVRRLGETSRSLPRSSESPEQLR